MSGENVGNDSGNGGEVDVVVGNGVQRIGCEYIWTLQQLIFEQLWSVP